MRRVPRDAILPAIADLMVRITGNDRGRNDAFKKQFVDWSSHRVDEELDGPLSDAIAPIPPRCYEASYGPQTALVAILVSLVLPVFSCVPSAGDLTRPAPRPLPVVSARR